MKSLWLKLPLFWQFQLAGWACFVIVTLPLKFELMGSVSGMLLLCLTRDGSSFLLTLALRKLYCHLWTDHISRMAVLVIAACTGAGILQNGLLFFLREIFPLEGEIFRHSFVVFSVFYERIGLLYGWSFLYLGMRYALKGKQHQLELALARTAQQDAELKMLRAQTSPHFLFNALNTIRAGVEEVSPSLGRMVQSLSDFLRFSLDHTQHDLIPLGREFDATRDYLTVEKARFGDRLEFSCEIEPSLLEALVPGIILQPLVENAVKYGQETSEPPLKVTVRISAPMVRTIRMEISNTGRWLEPSAREKQSHLGLQNLRHRLELLYPGRHGLDIDDADGCVQVSLEIPAL
jgi:two-component system LytT family sensor kinase